MIDLALVLPPPLVAEPGRAGGGPDAGTASDPRSREKNRPSSHRLGTNDEG